MFSYSDDVNECNLDLLSVKAIHEAASSLPDIFLRKYASKNACMQVLLSDFTKQRTTLGNTTFDYLQQKLKYVTFLDNSPCNVLNLIPASFEHHYGPTVAVNLRRPPTTVYTAICY